ncbi:hypothetical protein ACNKHN_11950 [Shigella flexneri]
MRPNFAQFLTRHSREAIAKAANEVGDWLYISTDYVFPGNG